MKPLLSLTAAALLIGTAAFAQDLQDTDGDGFYNLAEMQAVYPDLDEATFTSLDTDADGVLSTEEVTAARDAGMLGT